MFIEPNLSKKKIGSLEVICGSMFSGKTEELIRRLKRAKIAQQKVLIIKPAMDNRYNTQKIVSHDANFIDSIPVKNSNEIVLLINDIDVIGIDEAQFFDTKIIHVCENLMKQGIRVIAAGLDMDFTGNPFGAMPQLLAIADYITKLHAICVSCGGLANISFRKNISQNSNQQIVLGEKDIYEARCRNCSVLI
ncbi:MAG: thymidine kinase [Sediminibacterium sp.]|nr:thymidine kinase [Sediminibacterium sp.]